MPCASYQCNSAVRVLPLASRTLATPFNFRYRPGPNCFRSRAKSRIREAMAMVSMPSNLADDFEVHRSVVYRALCRFANKEVTNAEVLKVAAVKHV